MPATLTGVLIRLSDAISSATTLDEIYSAAMTGIRDATGIDRASILLFDSDGVMRFKAWSGLSETYRTAVEGHTPWSPDTPPPEPIVVADVEHDPELAGYGDVFAREGIAALAFIPIVSRRRVIGKFMLYAREPYAFDAGELPAALTIGYQIGFAVERARTLRDEADARARLTVLTEASERLLTALAVETVLDETLALASRVIQADAYAVWRRDGQTWRVASSRHLDAEFVAQELHDDGRVAFHAPIVATEVQQSLVLDARRQAYARAGIRSLVSVPVLQPDGTAASIVFYYRTPYTPSDMELQVAVALGHLAAASIRTARLFSEAQEANRLKDEFLATLSHELRTPLNVILGRTAMLTGAAGAAAIRHAADTIERNARILARLVEDLLDVSRITLGQFKLELQPLRLGPVIQAVTAALEPTARARMVELSVSVPEESPTILGDSTRLQQVLWNLLTNAIKFTPAGGRVTVTAEENGSHAVISVRDTGRGIAPDFLPHVFDMFRQAEPPTTRQFGGLGLGLSIVRRLAELHGGHVVAQSDGVGHGTTFAVHLPIPAGGHLRVEPPAVESATVNAAPPS